MVVQPIAPISSLFATPVPAKIGVASRQPGKEHGNGRCYQRRLPPNSRKGNSEQRGFRPPKLTEQMVTALTVRAIRGQRSEISTDIHGVVQAIATQIKHLTPGTLQIGAMEAAFGCVVEPWKAGARIEIGSTDNDRQMLALRIQKSVTVPRYS
jgi:hypothetical protein